MVAARYAAFNCNFIPILGVADIVDRYVVVLAPKERNSRKLLTMSHHIQCSGPPLTLRRNPMIDPNVSASMRIWPGRNVSGGKHTACTGLETGIYDDATVDDKSRPYGKFYSRVDTSNDEIAFEDVSASQKYFVSLDRNCGLAELEVDTMLLVERSQSRPISKPRMFPKGCLSGATT